MNRGALIISAVIIIFLSACGKNEVSYYNHEDEVHIAVGESAELRLKNAPAGKTEADYIWTITGDTAKLSPGTVTGVQTHPGKLSGKESVTAKLTYEGVDYIEVFTVVVEKELDSITLGYPSITMMVGDEMPITYTTEPDTLSNGQKVQFSFSDDKYAVISDEDVLKALSEGDFVLSAKTGGAEASCEVHIFDEPTDADEKLKYLNSWQDSFSECGVLNDVVFYERYKYPGFGILLSEIPKTSGTKGSGKYMVIWEWPVSVTESDSFTMPIMETEARCEFTAALPVELRPEKWSDAEFVIHVKQGEYLQQGSYEKGLKAMAAVVDISLETMDGEVISILDQVCGELPEKIAVGADVEAEAYYGSFPEESRVRHALEERLKNLAR